MVCKSERQLGGKCCEPWCRQAAVLLSPGRAALGMPNAEHAACAKAPLLAHLHAVQQVGSQRVVLRLGCSGWGQGMGAHEQAHVPANAGRTIRQGNREMVSALVAAEGRRGGNDKPARLACHGSRWGPTDAATGASPPTLDKSTGHGNPWKPAPSQAHPPSWPAGGGTGPRSGHSRHCTGRRRPASTMRVGSQFRVS